MTREEIEKARRDREKVTMSCKISRNEYDKIREFCNNKMNIGVTDYCRKAIYEKLERDGFFN